MPSNEETSEVAALKELVLSRIAAMELSIRVAHDDLVRVPTEVQKQVGHLKDVHEERFRGLQEKLALRQELMNEKFGSVGTQFHERDIRAEQLAIDNKAAIDSAFHSAALARDKSEVSFTKQIDQLTMMIRTVTEATDGKISDIKERLTRYEGQGEGMTKTNQDRRAAGSYTATIIGLIIAFIGIVTGIFISLLKH